MHRNKKGWARDELPSEQSRYLAAGERMSLWFFQTVEYKAMEAALRSTLKLAWNRV
jgi:hypothetical protein